MKRFSLFLAVCIACSGLNSVYAESEAKSVIVGFSERTAGIHFINQKDTNPTGNLTLDGYGTGSAALDKTKLKRPIFYTFDLSNTLDPDGDDSNDYAVTSVYFLGVAGNQNTPIKFFDVPDNKISKADIYQDTDNDGTPDTYVVPDVASAFSASSSVNKSRITDAMKATAGFGSVTGAANITNYIKEKTAAGSNVISMMLETQWNDTFTFDHATQTEKFSRLYLELDPMPEVSINTPAKGAEVYENTEFDFSVTAIDNGSVASVQMYFDNTELEVTNTDNVYSASVRSEVRGIHTLKAVVTDDLGGVKTVTRDVTIKELIKTTDIILNDTESFTDVYFDLTEETELGYSIEKAWLLGDADVSDNIAEIYTQSEELAESVDLSTLKALDRADFVDQSVDYELLANPEDYNFAVDVTEELLVNFESGEYGIGLKISNAGLNKAPVLCVKYSGKNVFPTLSVVAPTTDEFIPSDTIKFEILAEDSDGTIEEVKLYINDTLLENMIQNGSNYYAGISGLELGEYTLKAEICDNGGKTVSQECKIKIVNQVAARKIAVLSPVAHSNIKYGDETVKGPDSNSNYWLEGSKANPYGKAYVLKYDISEISGYQIDKVEVLSAGTIAQTGIVAYLSEIYSNDWETGINYTELPEYSSKTVAEATVSGATALNEQGYEISSSNYKLAFDVTENAISKINSGEEQFSYLMTLSGTGTLTVGNTGARPVLYVTYRENKRPEITLTSPEKTVKPGAEIKLSATITDDDSTLTDITVSYDGESYTPTISGDEYTVTIPAEKVTDGVHEYEIKAIDWLGAENVLSGKLYAISYLIENQKFTNAEDKDVVLKAGETIKASADILNGYAGSLDAVMMIAIYDENNTMREFGFSEITLAVSEQKTIEASIVIPDTLDLERATVKAYITDGFRSMNILDSSQTLK